MRASWVTRSWGLWTQALGLLLLLQTSRPRGSAAVRQCHRIAPLGDLNCSWEARGDPAAPLLLHLQSQKYHPNRTHTVRVAAGQSWVTIPREQLTTLDKLLVWMSQADQPLGSPISVNLETRVKPSVPQLSPVVDFSEDEPLEASIEWTPPSWPSHKVLICQFRYQSCLEEDWVPLESEVKTIPLSPVELLDLELATSYRVAGRCRVQDEEDLWSEWSPSVSFQTPPFAPRDVWVSGNFCSNQEVLLLWKSPGSCMPISYRVWVAGEQEPFAEGVSCCSIRVPAGAHWAAVSATNGTRWELPTNLSLVCLDSAPRSVVVHSGSASGQLRVSWWPGSTEPEEYVVDWAGDTEPPEEALTWLRLPAGRHSAMLAGNFTKGVPYRVTVTGVWPWGLAPALPAWGFIEELAPVMGPTLWRLQDDSPGTPSVAWAQVPRRQLRGHLTHYTVCSRSGAGPASCMNVSGTTQNVKLPHLQRGPCELWVTASTVAGQGPPGPSLWLYLPDNSFNWAILPGVLSLWGLLLLACGLTLTLSGRCPHLHHKVLPRWVWENVPDPANSQCGQPHMEEVPQVQSPGDLPVLEVEEIPTPEPTIVAPPQLPATQDCGYEKHFLPTPEELGLLNTPRS
ncbi:interleukin-27 receptor subunit alpha [Ochotona curzoniae]|uniref:interleukin-27 receptor subunit alpha n=1 Tax=Ochotona curzoniae TaxID=130825 RepID=UPI001B34806F|nr:interleukin-27 receptor subunit alpha [Ochotona curzoniae]